MYGLRNVNYQISVRESTVENQREKYVYLYLELH